MSKRQFVASLSSLIGTIWCGMAFTFTSTLLPQIHEYVTDEMGSWLAGISLLSMLVGIVAGGLLMRKYGRRPFLIWVNVPWLVGWICMSLATRFWMLLVGGAIVGAAAGFYGNLATIYLIEMPDPNFRGFFANVDSLCYAFGILLQNVAGILLPWQVALQVTAFPAVLAFATAFHAPETPNWLIANGRPDEARENFFRLRGVSDENEEEFATLLNKSTTNLALARQFSIAGDVCNRRFLRSLFVVSVAMSVYVVSGIDTMAMYSIQMVKDISEDVNVRWAIVVMDVFGLVSCAVFCFVVERLPRRTLFFGLAFVEVVALLVLASCTWLSLSKPFLILFLGFYEAAGTMGGVPWLLAGELFPDVTRELGNGICTVFYYILAFGAVKINPFLIETIGISWLFVAFAGLTVVCLVVLYFTMPETRGYTLQQLEEKLYGPPRQEEDFRR